MEPNFDADFVIIGSGFGGSVSALRLAEKGYRVVVLEQGRRIGEAEMTAAAESLRKFLWAPRLGMFGYFSQAVLRHLTAVRGVGVGGGSIVYAGVLLEPKGAFFSDPTWGRMGVDWRRELAPHYSTARRMLGVQDCPSSGAMDDHLRQTARALGAEDTFGPTPLGIHFGEKEKTVPDPYFDGRGPARTGCRLCGECMGGCPYGSKNSLDFNYLHLAEQEGVEIRAQHRVERIQPLDGGGYRVLSVDPLRRWASQPPLRARQVVIACGTLGTLETLFRGREEHGTLPHVSKQLGAVVRTNSEAIVAVTGAEPVEDPPQGPAISSHFYLDGLTHITQNRFPRAFEFMRWQVGPLVDGDGDRPGRRRLATLASFLSEPRAATAAWRGSDWYRRASVLTVMQDADNQLRMGWGRGLAGLGAGLRTTTIPGKPAPSYLPVANVAARSFAQAAGGVAGNALTESLLGTSNTAHILGGCHMGRTASEGVIDANHQVFGHPGLYVVDGAAVSANPGVNPSLTITALAERCMSLIPPRAEANP